jgi:hypothetical protein
MAAKLTLYLKEETVRRAKRYAAKNRGSLSGMVERYFNSLAKAGEPVGAGASPLVRSLHGIIRKSKDPRKEYGDHLARKYA